MSEITLEKTHGLLEKLADYVMTEIPAIKQKLDQKADKTELINLDNKVNTLGNRVNSLDNKVNMLLEGMDAQSKQLEMLSTDMKSRVRTLDIHEQRLAMLEERVFGERIRDDQENYKDKNSEKA
ncbi:MAG: hypothetical protein U5R06_03710 [candidate division KSB1 bacterium]|nr:hypothetical protein [candidate division KSB1 bacterium]